MQAAFLLKNQLLSLGAATCFGQKKAPTTYQADGAFAEQNAKRTAHLFLPKLDINGSVFKSIDTQELAYPQKIGGAL